MRGGHRYGVFFFIQATEYIKAYNESLPEFTPTPEEVDSGLTRLSEDFGFTATLYRTAREMNMKPEELIHWSAREFYHLVRYLAWEGHAQREYSEIMAAKSRQASK
jgi:hypothetical protein